MQYKNYFKNRYAAPKESNEQVALFQWAAYAEKQYPELRGLFHVPNGGARDKITGARLKREGVKAGVPDVLLLAARGEFHGLAVEMKRQQGGCLSQNQKTWINRLNAQGYKAVACKGATEAIKTITEYLNLGRFCRVDAEAVEAVLGGICDD